MIGLEWKRRRRRRRRSSQFNNVILNAQNKVNYSKITEIREERNAKLIYTGSATSRAYVQSSSNPLEILTNFVKKTFLQLLNTQGIPFPCVQETHNSRYNQSLDYNLLSEMNRKISIL